MLCALVTHKSHRPKRTCDKAGGRCLGCAGSIGPPPLSKWHFALQLNKSPLPLATCHLPLATCHFHQPADIKGNRQFHVQTKAAGGFRNVSQPPIQEGLALRARSAPSASNLTSANGASQPHTANGRQCTRICASPAGTYEDRDNLLAPGADGPHRRVTAHSHPGTTKRRRTPPAPPPRKKCRMADFTDARKRRVASPEIYENELTTGKIDCICGTQWRKFPSMPRSDVKLFSVGVDVSFRKPVAWSPTIHSETADKLAEVAGFPVASTNFRVRTGDILYNYDIAATFFGTNAQFTRNADRLTFNLANGSGADVPFIGGFGEILDAFFGGHRPFCPTQCRGKYRSWGPGE